ncbi:MAG: hypothetical protein PHU68_07165 [Paludibacter sp.]|nr:hypothetical protein [Paludibacter sp.]
MKSLLLILVLILRLLPLINERMSTANSFGEQSYPVLFRSLLLLIVSVGFGRLLYAVSKPEVHAVVCPVQTIFYETDSRFSVRQSTGSKLIVCPFPVTGLYPGWQATLPTSFLQVASLRPVL